MTEEILIIRHGAFGDMVQSTGPIRAIRQHHRDARITLLTSPAFQDFMSMCPWIDRIWLDERAPWYRVKSWWPLFRLLRGSRFDRVYDLQTSRRSSFYFRFFPRGHRPEWSGIAAGASHFHANPQRNEMHTLDRQRDQLHFAGIEDVPGPGLGWVEADVSRFGLPGRYALLVPGGSAHRPAKRWPAERYAALAGLLAREGVLPVILGGPDERGLGREIAAATRAELLDLSGRTRLDDIVGLARGAMLAVGNDTGPMHAIAVAGCPSVVLFSDESDPKLCAPRGRAVAILRQTPLADLKPERVLQAAETILDRPQVD